MWVNLQNVFSVLKTSLCRQLVVSSLLFFEQQQGHNHDLRSSTVIELGLLFNSFCHYM